MKKIVIAAVFGAAVCAVFAGCGNKSPEIVEVSQGAELVYLPISAGKASSFDKTPDWAPAPDPMAPADGDMLTRWSSDYEDAEQWIYFDLGQECVVSDVIIRWEKAYAKEYKILVSNDAQAWNEVSYIKASEGGDVESVFKAVKCRYVKIFGLKKANEDWGISIWEVEIYGPASYNTHAAVTKEKYLSGSDEQAAKEEADKMVGELAALAVSVEEKPFQKGAVYTSWVSDELFLPASDLMLVHIRKTGLDSVAIMVPAYQETLESGEIFVNDGPGGDTPSIESLRHAVEVCHKLGLRVMIKPHVDPRTDEARMNIIPSPQWFDSYKKFILKYAVFAQEVGAELFSVGTELEATTFETWAPRWDDVINSVRGVYTGKVVYSANWTEYKGVTFWDKMDFIGIDAYFPLTGSNEPLAGDLVKAWEKNADEIEAWLNEKGLAGKGVIFTEIGYPSADGANKQPWAAVTDKEDQAEQADCFDAMFSVLLKRNWFKGYYLWQYFPQERWSPLGFTVKGKKAQSVIEKWVSQKTE